MPVAMYDIAIVIDGHMLLNHSVERLPRPTPPRRGILNAPLDTAIIAHLFPEHAALPHTLTYLPDAPWRVAYGLVENTHGVGIVATAADKRYAIYLTVGERWMRKSQHYRASLAQMLKSMLELAHLELAAHQIETLFQLLQQQADKAADLHPAGELDTVPDEHPAHRMLRD